MHWMSSPTKSLVWIVAHLIAPLLVGCADSPSSKGAHGLTVTFQTDRCDCSKIEKGEIWLLKSDPGAGTGGFCLLQQRSVGSLAPYDPDPDINNGAGSTEGDAGPAGNELTFHGVSLSPGETIGLALSVYCRPDKANHLSACCISLAKALGYEEGVDDFDNAEQVCSDCAECNIKWTDANKRLIAATAYKTYCLSCIKCGGFKEFDVKIDGREQIDVESNVTCSDLKIERAQEAPNCNNP